MLKLILFLSLCLSTNVFADKGSSKVKGGFSESYGGDLYISEFQSIMRDIINTLDEPILYKVTGWDKGKIISLVESTEVVCEGSSPYNLVGHDTRISPSLDFFDSFFGKHESKVEPEEVMIAQRVKVNCTEWIGMSQKNKYRLVMHNYLTIMHIDDYEYAYSSKLLKNYLSVNRNILDHSSLRLRSMSAAVEFQLIINDVFNTLDDSILFQLINWHKRDLIFLVKNTNVICSREKVLILDSVWKDAISYPFEFPQKIEVNCANWKKASLANKYRLVIHEYLNLMLIDDSSYEYSSKLLEIYLRPGRSREM